MSSCSDSLLTDISPASMSNSIMDSLDSFCSISEYSNDADIQYKLGRSYYSRKIKGFKGEIEDKSDDVVKNNEKAVRYFRLSADQGHAIAQQALKKLK